MKLAILLLVTVVFAVIRLFIPTELDWSITSIYKDIVHIFFGILLVYCFQLKSKPLILSTVLFVLYEVLCVFLFR